jgi:hypothetical protein
MHRLTRHNGRISKDMRCHDQSFVGMFRLISLISLIAVGMALLAGVLAWFIVQPSAVSRKAGRATAEPRALSPTNLSGRLAIYLQEKDLPCL